MAGAHPLSPTTKKTGPGPTLRTRAFVTRRAAKGHTFLFSFFSRRAGSGELRTQNMCPKSIRMIMDGISMARHGPIFGQNEPYVPPPGSFLNTSQALGPSWPQGGPYRSEGFPCTRLFHPWARWGGPGGQEKFRVVVARPGPGPGSARPFFFKTLQDVTGRYKTLQDVTTTLQRRYKTLQDVTTTLQDVTGRHETLQDVTGRYNDVTRRYKTLQDVTRRYRTLQDVTRRYRTLQDVTRRYSDVTTTLQRRYSDVAGRYKDVT